MSRSGRRSAALAAGIVAALLVVPAGAAWAAPEGRIQQVETGEGTVDFLFSAEGLTAGERIDPDSVAVTLAGIEAPSTVTSFSESDETPQRTVILTLDTSSSMGKFGKLTIAKSAANTYLDTLPGDVEAGLVTFANETAVEVAPTTDRAALRDAIAGLQAQGGTSLNDAVIVSVDTLGTEGSRNIVLLSDGNDSDSEASAKEARADLAASGVVLDAVSLGEAGKEKALARYAAAGNGSVVTTTTADALTAAFKSAALSVENQLAVRSTVPEGVESGTVELAVTAQVGDQQISDSTATIVTAAAPTAAPSGANEAVAASATDGLFSQDWLLWVVIAAVFVSFATIGGIAVGAIDAQNRKEGRVARRLEEVSFMGPPPAGGTTSDSATVLGESVAVRRAVSFAERVAASRDNTTISRKLEEADVSLRPGEWVVVHALIALLAGLLATLFTGFNILLSLVAFALGLLIPWMYLGWRANQRRAQFYAALPDAMQLLAGSLSAGYSLPQAFDTVARESTGPLGEEVNRALLESRLGLPLEETLEAAAQRMESKDFHWVVMAIRINRRVGGNLAEVLTNVGRTLRERERLRRQVRTLSAEGRMSGWILGALPILLLVYMFVVRPEYISPMFGEPIGWVLAAIGVVSYVIGIFWMRNLVRMEV